MIQPPDGHDDQPHKIGKHYYMMMAEMMGNNFKHDEYCIMASWMLTFIAVNNTEFQDQVEFHNYYLQ